MLNLPRGLLVRALPFAVFMAFLAVEDVLPRLLGAELDWRWLYAVKIALTALVVAVCWRHYDELRGAENRPAITQALLAVLVGVLLFWLWIHLDHGWMTVGQPGAGFIPLDHGQLDPALTLIRLAGAVLVVPLVEELFWRSLVMRWLDQHDFLGLAPARISLRAVLASSLVFGFAHQLWLAGLLAGLVYALLYQHTQRLWTAVLAHAATNLSLGLWVIATASWQYW